MLASPRAEARSATGPPTDARDILDDPIVLDVRSIVIDPENTWAWPTAR